MTRVLMGFRYSLAVILVGSCFAALFGGHNQVFADTSKSISAALAKVEITTPNTWPAYTCIGTDFNLTAEVKPNAVTGGTYHWTKAGGDADGTFTPNDAATGGTVFKGTTEGTISLKVEYRLNGTTLESQTKDLKVISIESLLAAGATEIDDGDANDDTKLFYIFKRSSGTMTVTAIPKPVVTEANLPACWSLTGGTGAGKLQRTVSKSTSGQTVITCTSGTKVKTTTIWVVDLQVEFIGANAVCDGAQPTLKIRLEPVAAPVAILGNLPDLRLESKTDSVSRGNPAGTTTLAFDAFAVPAYTTKIQNAMWYSTQADNCNSTSAYEIKGKATDNGFAVNSITNPHLTIDAGGGCVNGSAGPTGYFSGAPAYATVENPPGSHNWETTVAIGTFVKTIVCTTNNVTLAISQYWQMVEDEENYHVGQLTGTNGHLCDDLWLAANVLTATQTNQPYVAATQAASLAAAQGAFNAAQIAEINRSNGIAFPYPGARRCAIEAEAKTNVHATYICRMPCSYPACP